MIGRQSLQSRLSCRDFVCEYRAILENRCFCLANSLDCEEALTMEKVMKKLVLGLLISIGFASATWAQDCSPVYYCCAMPTTVFGCCAHPIGQETAPSQEPAGAVEQVKTDQGAVPSSVLISPAPDAAVVIDSPVVTQPSVAVSTSNSRSIGGSNLFRRRGAFMGRLFGRLR